jgi:hypothetical protein
MKRVQIVLVGLGMVLALWLHGQTLTPVSSDDVPAKGTRFMSLQTNFPPLPFDPFPQLPLYLDGSTGNYYYDTTDFDLRAYFAQVSGNANNGESKDDLPAPPGGWGTNSGGSSSNSFVYTFDTNGLWLELTNVSGEMALGNLHNATNQVYALWSTTDLMSGWQVETEVWPSNLSVMPFSVETLGRSNLFLMAQDWTEVTHGGNTTPDWWFWEYFGTTALSDTNLDSQGYALAEDYESGYDPNVISFALSVTNKYVNLETAPVQIGVTAGIPSYMAALVDDTNWADANWVPSQPVVNVPLGSVQGWHIVWIGLRGLPPQAQQTWDSYRIKFDTVPPLLVVTNPSSLSVMSPMIEIQGYCPEALLSLTYDLSNSAGISTNQQGLILDQYYDSNTWEFTTNTFQAFDVPLTNGMNMVTFHATDLAGNVTVTNLAYTLSYVGRTNPPTLQLNWPQDRTQIGGSAFTLRGSVDDFTTMIQAVIVDMNGDTNTVQAQVERNGNYWIPGMGIRPMVLILGDSHIA